MKTDYHEQADKYLAKIAGYSRILYSKEAELAEKIAAITADYSELINGLKKDIKDTGKSLISLMKKNTNEFFTDEIDRLDLINGALLHQVLDRVKRARTVTTDLLESLGHDDAVKIAKSVDWDTIEKWSDIQLAEIGTERVQKENFEYEIFDTKDSGND